MNSEVGQLTSPLLFFPYAYCVLQYEYKTDKSKTGHFSFGGKLLTDKKSPPLFLGQFSFRPTIFFVFVFSFSLFQRIGPENAVEGSWGVDSVNSLPKVHSKVR
jgi:hypothetical protein